MNVDEWARCGQFLLINGPGVVIVYIGPWMGHVIVLLYRLGFRKSSPYKGDSVRFLLNYRSW